MNNNIEDTVIKSGFCVGCGVCTAYERSPYIILKDREGKYQANKVAEDSGVDINTKTAYDVCPFTTDIKKADISNELFNNSDLKVHSFIGRYSSLYSGYVNSAERLKSSSGGLVSKVLELLFKEEKINGVIHVKKGRGGNLYEYNISYNLNEIYGGRKSRYYPIELSEVLKRINHDGKRYAVVGIPCFIKGLRLLVRNSEGYNINYFIGIICGQLKSENFTKLFTLPNGIQDKNVLDVDYRVKVKGTNANNYKVKIDYKNGSEVKSYITGYARNIYGANWGYGMLKYKSCDVCDDVFNETADIVFGDAWVKPYSDDWQGTNLVIIRNRVFDELLTKANEKNVKLYKLSEEDVLKTQDASIRHRIINIKYRIEYFKNKGLWTPEIEKTVKTEYSSRDRAIQVARMIIASKSHKAFNIALRYKSLNVFKFLMFIPLYRYHLVRDGFKAIVPKFIKKLLKRN